MKRMHKFFFSTLSCFSWAESHLMQSSLLHVMLILSISNVQSMEHWPLQ